MVDLRTELSVLREAVRAVPSVRYALGLVGVAAAAAIAASFFSTPDFAIFGVVVLVALMVLLYVFSKFADLSIPGMQWLAAFLCWSIAILFVLVLVALLLSYFLCWPLKIGPDCRSSPTKLTIVDHELLDDISLVEQNGQLCFLDMRSRRSNSYRVKAIGDTVLPFVVMVYGYASGTAGEISLGLNYSIYDANRRKMASVSSKVYKAADAWRSQPLMSCLSPDVAFMKLPQLRQWLNKGAIPYIVTLSCFKPGEIALGENLITVTATDDIAVKSATHSFPVYIEQDPQSIGRMPIQCR